VSGQSILEREMGEERGFCEKMKEKETEGGIYTPHQIKSGTDQINDPYLNLVTNAHSGLFNPICPLLGYSHHPFHYLHPLSFSYLFIYFLHFISFIYFAFHFIFVYYYHLAI